MPGLLLPRLLSVTVSAAAISGFAIASLPSLSYASNEGAVAWILPGDEWKTFETEHFIFNFLSRHEQHARRAATISETQWPILTKRLGWMPKDKVQVVLTDDFDVSNGWAHVEPWNQMRLFLSPPDGGTTLEAYDDWLNLLITHELTHVIHIDMARGIPAGVRKVLGRNSLTFPHAYQPGFLIEGLAVYTETDHEQGIGRGQSNGYDMQMRMEVVKGIDDLDQVAITLRDWPIGKHYLYGAYYYQFLSEQYGEQKLREYLALYSRNIIPFVFLNPDIKQVYGKSYPAMWDEFRLWLQQKFQPQIDALNSSQVTPLQTLSDDGYFLDASATDGQNYYYLFQNGEDRQGIVRMTRSGEKTLLANVQDASNLDVNSQQQLVYTRLVHRADGRSWSDIFTLEQGEERRLTYEQRYRDVRWLSGGHNQPRRLLAKRLTDGISQLDLLSNDGQLLRTVWRGTLDDVLGEYSVSPDGQRIVATVKRKQQGWNLELLDLASGQWEQITDSKAIESSPQFINDQTLLFAADYQQTFNIYTLDLTSGQLKQWSHLMGGALAPQWINGEIFLQNYTAEGYQHSVLQTPKVIATQPLSATQGRYNYPDPYATSASHSEIRDYSPWPSLKPTRWMPVFGGDDHSSFIGASIDGNDALLRHSYLASIAFDSNNNLTSGALQYFYDNKWQLSALREHSYTERTIDSTEQLQIRQSDVIELARINLFSGFENRLQFSVGLHSDQEQDLSGKNSDTPYVQYQAASKEGLLGARLDFSNVEGYLHTPGFSWGHNLSAIWETNDAIDSDYDGDVINLNWSLYTDLPGRQVLAFNSANAYAFDQAKPFELGGNDIQLSESLFGRDSWALRGYSDAVQAGTRLNVNSIEWRTHLGSIERNWGVLPLGLGDMSASVFIDHGAAWQEQQHAQYLTSAGVELSTELVLFYAMPLPVRLGYAYGFDQEKGKDEVYISAGFQF